LVGGKTPDQSVHLNLTTTDRPTEEREKSEKTVGENTENRRRDESQARGKEEDRRVIDLPSP
ncbi:hypothetical protein, partial [Klebsiella pneumoniae]|uniref:hypothetical protein n=1 Tax=Klebsiella pneumoniae TaxID=573 RepID=UPI00293638D4